MKKNAVSLRTAAPVGRRRLERRECPWMAGQDHRAGHTVHARCPPDACARALADPLAQELGQTVVAENMPAVGGMVALQGMARTPADGYTLEVGPAGALNTGAHRCASRRPKKRSGGVSATTIGSVACWCRKKVSRTWSSRMETITRPRRDSTAPRRVEVAYAGTFTPLGALPSVAAVGSLDMESSSIINGTEMQRVFKRQSACDPAFDSWSNP